MPKSNLTPNQTKELEVLNYFELPRSCYTVPANCRTITSVDIQESENGLTPDDAYFAITGKGDKSVQVTDRTRLYQMIDAKRWRHRHVEMYEEGFLDQSMPYPTILEDIPESVAEYLAGAMFKGHRKDVILSVWKAVNV